MTKYYVEYVCESPWISGTYCCDTLEEANNFIEKIKSHRTVINLTLEIHKKII